MYYFYEKLSYHPFSAQAAKYAQKTIAFSAIVKGKLICNKS
jgi:hypothetical protein